MFPLLICQSSASECLGDFPFVARSSENPSDNSQLILRQRWNSSRLCHWTERTLQPCSVRRPDVASRRKRHPRPVFQYPSAVGLTVAAATRYLTETSAWEVLGEPPQEMDGLDEFVTSASNSPASGAVGSFVEDGDYAYVVFAANGGRPGRALIGSEAARDYQQGQGAMERLNEQAGRSCRCSSTGRERRIRRVAPDGGGHRGA